MVLGMGNTGEVRLKRVEGNYEEWGIEIMVSFRDENSMDLLTGSRQSGGVSFGLNTSCFGVAGRV
jgi:hypothetical protein